MRRSDCNEDARPVLLARPSGSVHPGTCAIPAGNWLPKWKRIPVRIPTARPIIRETPRFGATTVIRARLILPLMLLCLTASFAGAAGLGVFGKKGKSEAQIKRLIETLRTDPDEAKRRAAIADLHDADPRAHPDVISALIASLQKDGSATVRGDAAAAIGHYHHVFPLAGMALEAAAELDASPAVRGSAQQALWEYHLVGYRSLRGADGIAGQSKEPPIARPASLQPPVLPAIPQPMPTRPVWPLPAPGPNLPPIAAQPPSMARALAKAVFTPRRPVLGPLAMLRMLTPP